MLTKMNLKYLFKRADSFLTRMRPSYEKDGTVCCQDNGKWDEEKGYC